MKGTTINFKLGDSVITGKIYDTILYSLRNNYYAETHYLVKSNEGHIHIVHPSNITEINP